jgi:glyoxylase-like metal-dependent hydrolase (beta-lactamase superfamily II)
MIEIGHHVYAESDYTLVTVGAVLTDSGWVCIDTPPYPRDAHAWRAALQKISPLPVLYVVNTDHHRDRILGNVWFDGIVVAHARSAEAMLGLRNGFVAQAAEEMSANDNELVEIASVKTVPPQISYTESMRIACGGREVMLNYRPSTSGANTWVTLAEDRVVFAGDAVVTGQHPVITESASKAWLNDLVSLRQPRFADWTVVPGRGKIEPVARTENLSDYLRVARRRITSLLRAERPRSEIGGLLTEFLSLFPYDHKHKDEAIRRVKIGLEAIYEELRNSQDEEPDV